MTMVNMFVPGPVDEGPTRHFSSSSLRPWCSFLSHGVSPGGLCVPVTLTGPKSKSERKEDIWGWNRSAGAPGNDGAPASVEEADVTWWDEEGARPRAGPYPSAHQGTVQRAELIREHGGGGRPQTAGP